MFDGKPRTRRNVGGMVAALLATSALAACATQAPSVTVTVNKIEGYFQSVVNGINALAASPAILALMSATQVAAVNALSANAQTVINEVEAAASTVLQGTAQGWASQIEVDFNQLVALLGSIPGVPANATTIIEAINVLLPILLASVQAAVPTMAKPSGMSPDQATAILANPKV
jgi:hypothetical protein